jgi:hypothetical protein
MCVTVNLETKFHILCVNMLVVCLYTKFHIHNCCGLLVLAIKLKPKENFHTAIMLQFYILEKYYFTKVGYFTNTCYNTTFQDPKVRGTSVTPASQVHKSAMLLLQCRKLKSISLGWFLME